MHVHSGLYFERLSDGSVRIMKTKNSEVIMDLAIDADMWCSIIACMSYYGEEDYGWYRAKNFHQGIALTDETPLKTKPIG